MTMNIYDYIRNKGGSFIRTNNVLVVSSIIGAIIVVVICMHYRRHSAIREGMNVEKELKTAVSSIRDVGSKISRLPRKIGKVTDDINKVPQNVRNGIRLPIQETQTAVNSLKKEVDTAVDKVEGAAQDIKRSVQTELNVFLKRVQKDVTTIVTQKIRRFFVRFADEFKGAFIDPMASLFKGIGTVFTELGKILKKVTDKIVTLPECVPFYSFSVSGSMSKKFLPGWLKLLLGIWESILQGLLILFTPILMLVGIDVVGWKNEIRRKCYKLETKTNTDKIKGSMEKAGNTFLKSFGRVNFKRVVS